MSHCATLVHGRKSELGYAAVKRLKEKARTAAFVKGLNHREVRILDVTEQDGGITGRWEVK